VVALHGQSGADKFFGNGVCLGACTDEELVELDDVAGIICCWQDHVLDAFHAELEAMKADDELHLYGLDKPETLIDIEQGEYIYHMPLHSGHILILTHYDRNSPGSCDYRP